MPARIQVACEENRPFGGIHCGYVDVEIPDDLSDPHVADAVAAAGWTHDKNGYHCPKHDPAARWLRVRLSTDQDIEPLPGLRMRIPRVDNEPRIVTDAEILFDPDRWDVEDDGNGVLGRAKPVGTDWPEREDG